jgi:hypothetical protein
MQSKNCNELITAPEYAEGEWVIPCLNCGVRNIVVVGLDVVAWRG